MPVLDILTRALVRRAAPAPPLAVPLPAAYKSTWTLDPAAPYYLGGGLTYGTEVDYAAAAGDLLDNSAIMACIGWLMGAEPLAPWRVLRRVAGPDAPQPTHPLLTLLRRPNPFYSGLALRQATVLSFNLAGNAYWLKERNALGQVIRLWYEPHFTIRATWPRDGGAWLSGYEYWRNGRWLGLGLEDVVHFRNGVDPRNPRYGLSRLGSALRAVATDQEAARYSYAMLKNTGIVPHVLSPKYEGGEFDAEDRQALKTAWQRNTTGDQRGTVMVTSGALDVNKLGFPPSEMNAEGSHHHPESRIAALLNTPAVIVGLLVGLEHSIYNNMAQAEEHAWAGNLLPYFQTVDDTLTQQLIPDFGDPALDYVDHDLSGIRVLQADETARQAGLVAAWNAGGIMLDELRAGLHLPPLEPKGAGQVFKPQGGGGPQMKLLPGGDADPLAGLLTTNGAHG